MHAGLSPSRIRNAHQVLSQVLAAGVEAARIARNPAVGVRLPRIVRREMHFLTAAQVELLAEAIIPPYAVLIRFAAYTGLRAGEVAALRVKDLNLFRGTCEVVESVTEVDGRLVRGPTKTYAHRRVYLPRFLCDQVGVYLVDRPHGPEDPVFTGPRGGPIREHKFVELIFKPAAIRAGLPSALRVHDLRHTCASLLIAHGASIKAVQAQLGHASATVTLDRYGHLFPDELARLAERMEGVYADLLRTGRGPSAGESEPPDPEVQVRRHEA